MSRTLAILLGALVLSANAWAADRLPYREYLKRNSANSSKLSLGMTREQVMETMGQATSKVRDGPLSNPWKVDAFLRNDDAFEVLYYLVRRHPPFFPISDSQTISVVLKNGVLVAWGRNAHVESLEPANRSRTATTTAESRDRPHGRYEQGYRHRVAAVVGINRYEAWPPLEGAVRDARAMRAALAEMGFDPILELYDSEANRERILDLLGRQIPAKAGPDDQVVVFFAGHGQTESLPGDQVRGYVVPVDGDPERPFATAISMASIRDLSARIQAKHILFVMDSCYSGIGFQRGIRPVAAGPGLLQELTSRRAVQLIAAGTGGQEALEVGGRGLFTTKLLEGLAGEADANADGAVTASELGGYVTPAVSAASRDRQTPQFGTLEGTGDAVFRLRR